MAAMKKLRTPTKRPGGKSYLARRIIDLFPPHTNYAEPFVGGASVLLNLPKADCEVAGDLDADLMNFWTVLQEYPRSVISMANEFSYTEKVFDIALDWMGQSDPIYRACGFLIRNRFSRGGMGKDFAWSERLRGTKRPGGPIPGDANAWDTIREELPAIAERIKDVDFRCCDALDLIQEYDSPDTLAYLDSPYLHETRKAKNVYMHEMSRDQHIAMLELANQCKSMIAISGYDSPLYTEMLAGWDCQRFDLPNNAGQGKTKQRRVECVWRNPACMEKV